MFTLFYWQNNQTGLGIKGAGECLLKFNAVYQTYAQFRLLLNYHEIPECWNSPRCILECKYWLVDAMLFLSAAGLLGAVMITWTQVWSNLKNRTSFPKIYKDEQKANKKKKAEKEEKKKREAELAAKEESKGEAKEEAKEALKEEVKDQVKEETQEEEKE